jgi:hypothetical protein
LKTGGVLLKSGYQFQFGLKSDKDASIFSEAPHGAFAQICSAAVECLFRNKTVMDEMTRFHWIVLNGFQENYETKGIESPRILDSVPIFPNLFTRKSGIFFRT